tara:strand:- start:12 stop:794 length:783 start_codon:yes stop_codon:yes gene_type:complete
MKAGFVGFTGAAGATAGLIGSGGSLGLSGSILAGGSAVTPVSTTAAGTFGVAAPISSSTGFTVGGGTFTAAPISTTGMGFSTATPVSLSGFTTTGGTLSAAPILTTGTGFSATTPISLPSLSKGALSTSSVLPKSIGTTSGKSGFLNGLRNTLIDGVKAGGKNLVATGLYNLVMHGDIKGPEFEQDLVSGGGGRAGSYTGSYALPDSIRFTQQGLGSDTIGSTYVNMLQNLNYGTGSLDYARHTNMALMRGIQVPQIQYA